MATQDGFLWPHPQQVHQCHLSETDFQHLPKREGEGLAHSSHPLTTHAPTHPPVVPHGCPGSSSREPARPSQRSSTTEQAGLPTTPPLVGSPRQWAGHAGSQDGSGSTYAMWAEYTRLHCSARQHDGACTEGSRLAPYVCVCR